jgi:methylated-DNA-[protein]-cysteine S-methyltransferase
MLTTFQKRVLNEVSKIPKGKLTNYKTIAIKLKTSPRAIGQALKRNPFPIEIPCHRVIKSNKEIGGYKGKDYETKIKLLKSEGHNIKNNLIISA